MEAIVPLDYDSDALSSFISSRREWIVKTAKYYARLRDRCGGHEPGTIYFLGSKYRLNVVKDRTHSVTISETMKVITFHIPDRRMIRRYLRDWYVENTFSLISKRLPDLARKVGVQYKKISVKNQKSRWGSCSKKGNLNFNLLLCAAPREVMDYVIIHELVHLRALDHSRRFWEIVRTADLDYIQHKDWLTRYAPVIKIP